ncbi:chitin synthase-domain-containing protein [Cokeromyces recurvatus]|uniref:chitin synthase-domain-containing protein n=1 Tax=Cokeromyces recurvatus TaxID=90255 RepID=UPI00221EED96|nr:chitin synthase-domain-containing protein [Cokeromyces recurvatus]KAI7899778.1 chitin synthase-domain-containing protein [Cokeromyces recurvatus]
MPRISQRALASEAVVDLSSVNDINEGKVIDILRSKFMNYNIYTYVGSCNIIAVNPFKSLAQNDAQTSEEYVTSYKDISSTENPIMNHRLLNPHVFELANRAYFHMRRTGNDQIISFCGESGSGKTELHQIVVEHLLRLSANRKRSKTQAQIINGQKVLQAFGSSRTTFNESASRFGLYTEIHYNERGKIVGSKYLHYFLEKSRVTNNRPYEGNFNIFYWLLAGTEPDEKQVLQLKEDPKQYLYLARYGRLLQPEDSTAYNEFKQAMRAAGFRREHFSRIIQLLAAILHLGNVDFLDPTTSDEVVTIKNRESLDLVADFLGLDLGALETVLTFKTAMIGKDVTTLILNAEQASIQRDELAQTLYGLLFSWIVEHINHKTYTDEFNSFIGVLDLPGTQPSGFGSVGFEQFCIDYANERIHQFMIQRLFEEDNELENEGIQVPSTPFVANSDCVELLDRPVRGICAIFNKMSEKTVSGKRVFTDSNAVDSITKYNNENPALSSKISETGARQFAIQHFSGQVTYDPQGFIVKNNNQLLVDFIALFRGNADMPASWNSFALELFSDENLAIESHPLGALTDMVTTQQSAKPTRQPSMRQSKRKAAKKEKETKKNEESGKKTVLAQIQSAMDDLINSFQEATLWSVFCIRPNSTSNTTQFDDLVVQSQVRAFNLGSLASKMQYFYLLSMPHQGFLSRYAVPLSNLGLSHNGSPQDQCISVKELNQWTDKDMAIGTTKVFLSYHSWHSLEEKLRLLEKQDQKGLKMLETNIGLPSVLDNEEVTDIQTREVPLPAALGESNITNDSLPLPSIAGYSDRRGSYFSDDPHNDSFYRQSQYTESRLGGGNESAYNFGIVDPTSFMTPLQQPIPEKAELDTTEEEKESMTPGRRRWLWIVWALTFWIPNVFLIKCGRMKRKDVRIAWREKLALCIIITFMCGFVIWFLVFFSVIICPKENVFSINELANHNTKDSSYVAIRGEVFNLGKFASHHYPSVVPTSAVLSYAGKDATDLFPVQVSDLCENVSPYVSLDYQKNYTDPNAQYHDFRFCTGHYRKNWYYDQMTMLRINYKEGNMGVEWKSIRDQAQGNYHLNGVKMNRNWAVINNHIYDLTKYMMGGRYLEAPPGQTVPANVSTDFLAASVVNLFVQYSGMDITQQFNQLDLSDERKNRELVCLRNLFYVGLVDNRNSPTCQFSTYFLLVVTLCLCSVILFKFIAAIRFKSTRMPEELDKFVICQVTCYTEDEESLRKTIDSLATLRYDDKRKLIIVICDGMIVGSGNDRPTPRIVLDIFGVDPQVDPEALSFVSVGEGLKQHNRAKIYSGLYEVSGHVVPYLVIAKVGAPQERQKPGNRGKRDSQLIMMEFLNRVQYAAPMNPMQLEIYHQMRNVIGVSPEMYEYLLMVDADTEVMPDGLNFLVSSMGHDGKIIGVCGETTLANEKDTWVTMIQVYEYFISHHMIKAFESLFSTVSCLPGCFTMYRIRSVDGKRPLFVSTEIIDDYKINVVDTLHKKNLLYLGEDRYLTTLLLKHFPNYKTKFNSDAHCKTNAPDRWSVLVSQRRRWINSTVHNLGELVFLPQLCGFCCFSMRFVVMIDLISTLVQPALLGYLGFLIYKLVEARNNIPYITIITLCCTYGLQIILFIIYRRWEYIAWFFLSILALPVFSFYIPIYAYWHFDDFSWGNTRIVVGEKGQKVAVGDEGDFDPKTIPLMTWAQYEKVMLAEAYSDVVSQSSYPMGPPMSVHDGGAYSVAGGYSIYSGGGPTYSVVSGHSMPRQRYGPPTMNHSPPSY